VAGGSGPARPWQVAAPGLVVTVRLTPRGGRDAIDGVEQRSDGQAVLKVRVRAVPSEGEANAALVALVARSLAVPSRSVTLMSGATSRVKKLAIAGDGPTLVAALEKVIHGDMPRGSGASSKLDNRR
jgi:uncharacterized protein